jgi:cysteinyl-tRNA synthetase
VGQDNIDAAVNSLAGLDSFAARSAGVTGIPDAQVIEKFRERMDDDLDTPAAMAILFDTVRRANSSLDADLAGAGSLVAAVHEMCTALGLVLNAGGEVPAEDEAKAAALDDARAAKDFATADALRAELQAAGWTVETTKSGTKLRR